MTHDQGHYLKRRHSIPAFFSAILFIPTPGSSSGEFDDGLTPGSSTRWTLAAKDCQFLKVTVSAGGAGIYYQIFNPDGSFLLEQTGPDLEYKVQRWQNGQYVVEVMNRGDSNVSYTLTVGLD